MGAAARIEKVRAWRRARSFFQGPSCGPAPRAANGASSPRGLLVADRHPRRYRHGQFLLWEGSVSEGLYLVHSGQVKITRTGSDGKEQIMRLVQAGDVFGYWALDGSAHAADAVVMEDAVVCFIPKAEFQWLMGRERTLHPGHHARAGGRTAASQAAANRNGLG